MSRVRIEKTRRFLFITQEDLEIEPYETFGRDLSTKCFVVFSVILAGTASEKSAWSNNFAVDADLNARPGSGNPVSTPARGALRFHCFLSFWVLMRV